MIEHIGRKLIYIRDAEKIIGRSRLTLRRWWEKGKFPKPTLVNSRLAWRIEVIEEFIEKYSEDKA